MSGIHELVFDPPREAAARWVQRSAAGPTSSTGQARHRGAGVEQHGVDGEIGLYCRVPMAVVVDVAVQVVVGRGGLRSVEWEGGNLRYSPGRSSE